MAAPAAPCDDHYQALLLQGFGPAPLPFAVIVAPPFCFARSPCAVGPTPAHAAGAHTVCDACANTIEPWHTVREHARLTRPFIRRGPHGGAKYETSMAGIRALLCKFCEADEIALYKRNMALAIPAPPLAQDGWENTCTCHRSRLNLIRPPGVPIPGGHPRYCIRCRQDEMDQIGVDAAANRNELMMLARDVNGVRETAHLDLLTWRNAHGCPIACRCGRNTVAPSATARPKVTHCLCCGGVQVDVAQLRILRHENANIQARAAAGGLPVLNNIAANFNLAARPPASRNVGGAQVGPPNNNRK